MKIIIFPFALKHFLEGEALYAQFCCSEEENVKLALFIITSMGKREKNVYSYLSIVNE